MSWMEGDAYNKPLLSLSIEDRVKALRRAICDDPEYNGFDTAIVREAVLTRVAPGTTEWEATISPNVHPYLHSLD